MSNNDFAFYSKNPNTFMVQNVAYRPKTIKIFNYPIPHGAARDLMAIPGIGEADIRASLLKGELRRKIEVSEIIILFSDIDLLQFNQEQLNFLESAGVQKGTRINVSVTPDMLSGFATINDLNNVQSTVDLLSDNQNILLNQVAEINTEIGNINSHLTQLDGYVASLQSTIGGSGSGGSVTPGTGTVTYYLKQGIIPVGTKNGINRVFYTPDMFLDGVYNGNQFKLQVMLNGRMLIKTLDFEISKTGNSQAQGFNTITFTGVCPQTNSNLCVNYAVAITT